MQFINVPRDAGGETEKIHAEKPGSPNFINTKAEIFDFEATENDIIIKEEINAGFSRLRRNYIRQIICFLGVAIGTGSAAVFVMFMHEILSHYKYVLLSNTLEQNDILSPLLVIIWFLSVIIPAMIGCLLVVFIEPKAAGGGVAAIIGYVNGVNTTAAHSMKIMFVKIFSVLCCISSGLAGGMEGPMVHIGACIGACMTNIKIPLCTRNIREPFKTVRTDYYKRNFVGGGIAAGIAGAFFAPIGGFIMALEEGMIYWSLETALGIFICGAACQGFVVSVLSVNFGCAGCLGEKSLLYFSTVTATVLEYNYIDFFLIILEAIIAGFLGAAWNYCQLRLILLRKIYITKKIHQLVEMFVLAFTTALIGWMQMAALRNNCIEEPPHINGFHYASLRMECKKGKMTAIGGIIGLSQPSAIKLLFYDSDNFDILTLALFSLPYFFLSTFTMGTFISAGIFVPNILLGAAWGRCYGEIWKKLCFSEENFRPHVYAIVGAAAQLCGVIRVPLTIATIMVETCAAQELIFPIYIAMIVTATVGNTINHSIYHTQCYVAGMPIIENEPPPLILDMQVDQVMNTTIVSLTRQIKLEKLIQVLQTTKHHIFPILNGKKLEGTIRREELIQFLRYKLYNEDSKESYFYLQTSDRSPWNADKISLDDHNQGLMIDLGPFINRSPYTLLTTTSITEAYLIMGNIGSRHILIVNKNNEVVGVITRKDIVHVRGHGNVCDFHVSILPKK